MECVCVQCQGAGRVSPCRPAKTGCTRWVAPAQPAHTARASARRNPPPQPTEQRGAIDRSQGISSPPTTSSKPQRARKQSVSAPKRGKGEKAKEERDKCVKPPGGCRRGPGVTSAAKNRQTPTQLPRPATAAGRAAMPGGQRGAGRGSAPRKQSASLQCAPHFSLQRAGVACAAPALPHTIHVRSYLKQFGSSHIRPALTFVVGLKVWQPPFVPSGRAMRDHQEG